LAASGYSSDFTIEKEHSALLQNQYASTNGVFIGQADVTTALKQQKKVLNMAAKQHKK